MASYRTLVFAWGPLTINLHRFDKRYLKARFYGHSAVVFFGIGSVAWWQHARSWPYVRVLAADKKKPHP